MFVTAFLSRRQASNFASVEAAAAGESLSCPLQGPLAARSLFTRSFSADGRLAARRCFINKYATTFACAVPRSSALRTCATAGLGLSLQTINTTRLSFDDCTGDNVQCDK